MICPNCEKPLVVRREVVMLVTKTEWYDVKDSPIEVVMSNEPPIQEIGSIESEEWFCNNCGLDITNNSYELYNALSEEFDKVL